VTISECSIRCPAPNTLLRQPHRGHHLVGRGVTDRVKPRLQARLRAGPDVLGQLGGLVPQVPRGVAVHVGPQQTGGVRADRAVAEQVAAGADSAELEGGVDAAQLAPIGVHLGQRLGLSTGHQPQQPRQVLGAGDLGTRHLMHRGHPEAGSVPQRAPVQVGTLAAGDGRQRDRPRGVVGLLGEVPGR